ncbi:MAG: hypothetical protein WB420_11190, partial [Bradyrhizobium sp.]
PTFFDPRKYLQITRNGGQVKCAPAFSNRQTVCLNHESRARRRGWDTTHDLAAGRHGRLCNRGIALLGDKALALIRSASPPQTKTPPTP